MYILGMAEFMAKKPYDITICNYFFSKKLFWDPIAVYQNICHSEKELCVLVLNFYIKCIGKRSKIESHM